MILRQAKEKGGTAATLDALLDSLPTRSEIFMENVAADSKRQQRKESRLTQDDCKNTNNKRGNKIMKEEMKAFQVLKILF